MNSYVYGGIPTQKPKEFFFVIWNVESKNEMAID